MNWKSIEKDRGFKFKADSLYLVYKKIYKNPMMIEENFSLRLGHELYDSDFTHYLEIKPTEGE